jgi:hypothetical protein
MMRDSQPATLGSCFVRAATALLLLVLARCGMSTPASQLPTAHIRAQPTQLAPIVRVASVTAPTAPPAALPLDPVPSAAPAAASSIDQYRAWVEEARALYPYPESTDVMWQLMVCESSGQPELVADAYHGLFQYDAATWVGDWNPYRDQPILDPHAQIFATAKAWHDGNQGWWGCYGR